MAGKKGRSGRKPRWTDQQIEEAAEDLVGWLEADREHHVWFRDWAILNHLPPEYLSRWSAKNPVFRQAMAMAEMAQESALVHGGLGGKYNAKICALVLQSKHSWAGRQNLLVTAEDNRKPIEDALRESMPKDREEGRRWLESIARGQGTGPEAEAVRAAAGNVLGEIQLVDEVERAGTALCDN